MGKERRTRPNMNRVQNLSQFLQWLKERKAKRNSSKQSENTSEQLFTSSHDPSCKCRPCMKLPQIPREQRRLQKAIERTTESPDHIYEEIPPELVSSSSSSSSAPDGGCVHPFLASSRHHSHHHGVRHQRHQKQHNKPLHLDLALDSCHPTSSSSTSTKSRSAENINQLLRLKAMAKLVDQKARNKASNVADTKQDSTGYKQNKQSNDHSSQHDRYKVNENQKVQNKTDKDSSVNLGNLDFGQAKEFGGFLVVPLKDRMVFKRLDDPTNTSYICDTQLQPTCQTKVGSLPSDLDLISQVDDTQNIVYVNQSVIPKNLAEFKQVLTDHLKTQDSAEIDEDVKSSQKGSAASKSAFTRYIPSADTTCCQSKLSSRHQKSRTSDQHLHRDPAMFHSLNGYDPRRSSLSTESSEDSGGYFHGSDTKMPSSYTMGNSEDPDNSTLLRTSDTSEKSNDTYNEYDVRSDEDDCSSSSNPPEYDAFLQRAKQQRCLESQVQEIVRESGSDTDMDPTSNNNKTKRQQQQQRMGMGSSSSSSPLAMLDIDDILALVSSDDNKDILTDILYQDYSSHDMHRAEDIVSDLKRRISSPVTQSTLISSDKQQHKDNNSSNMPTKDLNRKADDRLSCRVRVSGGGGSGGSHEMKQQQQHQHHYTHVNTNNMGYGNPAVNQSKDPGSNKAAKQRKSAPGNRVLGDLMRLNHDRQLFF